MSALPQSAQLGFDGLIADAERINRNLQFERETGHLPSRMDEALPFYRLLLKQHHAAMLAADVDQAMALRKEARRLALRLNRGEPGILAGADAPGCVLASDTAAPSGTVPLWGQTGEFAITVAGVQIRIEMEGIFGICAGVAFWPGFAVHCVDCDKPFISETGYRSFLGINAEPVPALTPDVFVTKVLAGYIDRELKGVLVEIDSRYR